MHEPVTDLGREEGADNSIGSSSRSFHTIEAACHKDIVEDENQCCDQKYAKNSKSGINWKVVLVAFLKGLGGVDDLVNGALIGIALFTVVSFIPIIMLKGPVNTQEVILGVMEVSLV